MKLEVIARNPKVLGENHPLLFVHGTCHGAWCWAEHFLGFFAENGFPSFAVSLRGHGQSEGKEFLQQASVFDYVNDVEQVARTLTKSPVVIGHSLGGLVIQKYLEKHRAPAGVLIAPSPIWGMSLAGLPLLMKNPLLFAKTFASRDVQTLYGSPTLIHKMLFSKEMNREKIERYAAKFGKESFKAFLDMMFCLPHPKRVKSQMLVLGATQDAIVPQYAIKQTAKAYAATVKIFPDMAHDMMLEDNWKQVASFMLGWLKSRKL